MRKGEDYLHVQLDVERGKVYCLQTQGDGHFLVSILLIHPHELHEIPADRQITERKKTRTCRHVFL